MVQNNGGESLMKKRTDEEKRQMVDNACKLFTEAIEKTREAQRLLHLCGIECCDSLNVDEIQCFKPYVSNVQLYSGIKKMSGIIGTEPEFRPTYYDESKIDKIADVEPVQEWISVKDRLPDLIPCNVGTAYSEAVIAWTSGRKAMIAVWDGIDWIAPFDYWEAWGEEITHWMPLPSTEGLE